MCRKKPRAPRIGRELLHARRALFALGVLIRHEELLGGRHRREGVFLLGGRLLAHRALPTPSRVPTPNPTNAGRRRDDFRLFQRCQRCRRVSVDVPRGRDSAPRPFGPPWAAAATPTMRRPPTTRAWRSWSSCAARARRRSAAICGRSETPWRADRIFWRTTAWGGTAGTRHCTTPRARDTPRASPSCSRRARAWTVPPKRAAPPRCTAPRTRAERRHRHLAARRRGRERPRRRRRDRAAQGGGAGLGGFVRAAAARVSEGGRGAR